MRSARPRFESALSLDLGADFPPDFNATTGAFGRDLAEISLFFGRKIGAFGGSFFFGVGDGGSDRVWGVRGIILLAVLVVI